MFVVRILNKLMYKTREDDNGSHLYLGKFDKNGNAILKQMTHMYKPDQKRFNQKKKGLLEIYKISNFDTPQGLYKKEIKYDINGKRINRNYINDNKLTIFYNINANKVIKNKKR